MPGSPWEARPERAKGPSALTAASQSRRPSHGNFQRYYSIRRDPTSSSPQGETSSRERGKGHCGISSSSSSSPGQDPRVDALVSWWERNRGAGVIASQDQPSTPLTPHLSRVLDVGCNSGKVSLDLARSNLIPPPSLIFGVDVDEALIRAAKAGARSFLDGRQKLRNLDVDGSRSGGGKRRRVDSGGADDQSQGVGVEGEPTEIRFAAVDWARVALLGSNAGEALSLGTDEARVLREDEKGWDLIMVLSVTKWIHIHNSDSGLVSFLSRLCLSLNEGGALMLEAQPWKSYEQARRVLDPELRSRQRGLRLEPETDFEFLLTQVLGLRGPVELGQSCGFGFKRPLQLYVQPPSSQLAPTILETRLSLSPSHPPSQSESAQGPALLPLPWVPRNFKDRRKGG